MTKCRFCGNTIPEERAKYPNTVFCSVKCNQRSWSIRTKQAKYCHEISPSEWSKTCTGKGFLWEKFVANLIKGEWQGFGASVDIVCKGEKIDVKSCELYKRKKKNGKDIPNFDKQTGWWVFNRNINKDCDSFVCIGLVKGVPQKIFKIPDSVFKKGLVISPNKSKYDQYLISF